MYVVKNDEKDGNGVAVKLLKRSFVTFQLDFK